MCSVMHQNRKSMLAAADHEECKNEGQWIWEGDKQSDGSQDDCPDMENQPGAHQIRPATDLPQFRFVDIVRACSHT